MASGAVPRQVLRLLTWLAAAAMVCALAAAAQAQSALTSERLDSQVRLFAPGLPDLSAAAWAQVPEVAPATVAAAPAPMDSRTLYDQIVRGGSAHLKSLTAFQRQQLWTAAFRHPVAGLDDEKKLAKYYPQGFIGFCFGRAMAAHLLARQLGLAEDSVR